MKPVGALSSLLTIFLAVGAASATKPAPITPAEAAAVRDRVRAVARAYRNMRASPYLEPVTVVPRSAMVRLPDGRIQAEAAIRAMGYAGGATRPASIDLERARFIDDGAGVIRVAGWAPVPGTFASRIPLWRPRR